MPTNMINQDSVKKKNIFDSTMAFYFILGALTIQFLGFVLTCKFFYEQGYLPAPFIRDKSDSMMDLFNPMWWSEKDGRYTEWKSVYSPPVFIILSLIKYVFLGDSDFTSPKDMRFEGLSIIILYFLMSFFSIACVFSSALYKSFKLKERWALGVFFVLSHVVLFTIERGNLLIFAPLVIASLVKSKDLARAFLMAVLGLLKSYFLVFYLAYIIKADVLGLLRSCIIFAVIFLGGGLILDPNFLLMTMTTIEYSAVSNLGVDNVLAMNGSISSYVYLLQEFINGSAFPFFPDEDLVLKKNLMSFSNVMNVMIGLGGVLINRKQASYQKIIFVLCVIITNLSYTFGGYTLIIYIGIFPLVLEFMSARVLIFLILIMFLPLDLIVIYSRPDSIREVWLSGKELMVYYQYGMGSEIRPWLNFLILIIINWELWGGYNFLKKYIFGFLDKSLGRF